MIFVVFLFVLCSIGFVLSLSFLLMPFIRLRELDKHIDNLKNRKSKPLTEEQKRRFLESISEEELNEMVRVINSWTKEMYRNFAKEYVNAYMKPWV